MPMARGVPRAVITDLSFINNLAASPLADASRDSCGNDARLASAHLTAAAANSLSEPGVSLDTCAQKSLPN